MLKKQINIIIVLIFLSPVLLAQTNTYSPYSRFGIGELSLPGNGQNVAQGFTGIALRSNTAINYLNPASYTSLDTMSFLFDFGFVGSKTQYTTNTLNSELTNMNLHHIGIAFPITKFWKASVGITPFSSVGYDILDEQSDPNIGLIDYHFTGTGGLNRFYMGSSIMVYDKISIGFNYSYLFGFIENTQKVVFPTESTTFASTSIQNNLLTKDGILNLGIQYHDVFKDKFYLTLGVIYDSKTSLSTERTKIIQNFFPGNTVAIGDSVLLESTVEVANYDDTGNIIYQSRYGFVFAAVIKNKLNLSAEYELQNWSESLIMGESDSLANSSAYRFGLEYTPDYKALRSYFSRVHYRLGGYTTNSYLSLQGEQLKDYGITFGVGLPLRGTKTTFNLGMVLGQRGTLTNDLIKENYGMIHVSFTMHDFWFFKRKFD